MRAASADNSGGTGGPQGAHAGCDHDAGSRQQLLGAGIVANRRSNSLKHAALANRSSSRPPATVSQQACALAFSGSAGGCSASKVKQASTAPPQTSAGAPALAGSPA